MNFTRSAVTWLILSAALSACSGTDTIVALNVDADDRVALRDLTTLAVTFSQDGRSDFETTLEPRMVELSDGGLEFPLDYFARITMPDGWNGETDVLVEAMAGSRLLIDGDAIVNIRENETTAAFINLTFEEDEPEPEPSPADAGADAAAPDAGDETETGDAGDAGGDTGDADVPGLDASPDAQTPDAAPDAAPGEPDAGGDAGSDAGSNDAGDAGDAATL